MAEVVIKAANLSKYYRLGVINNGTLFRDLQTWWALKQGKKDPHAQIDKNEYDPTKHGFWALKDLNFEVKQGDKIGIIGKNGAGKSTLLKILSRITAPTKGSAKIKGRVASLLEVGTGFHGELTGRENIYLNGAILGMKKREVDLKMDEIVDFAGIAQHIDTPVKRYSSGMYVRLAFAVAAHLDSEILIADEVLAVGDVSFQKKALGKMNQLSTGEGRTVLFVSHNMSSIKALCNFGILLSEGKIVSYEHIDKIIQKYDEISFQNNTDLSNISNTYDVNMKRGSGFVHFEEIIFSKKNYPTNETINITFTVSTQEITKGLYFKLLVKTENNDILTAIQEKLEESTKKDFSKTYVLSIPANTFLPGRYPLYFWLGDKLALSQGTPTNYEVLDNLTQPLHITQPKNMKVALFPLSPGMISIRYNLGISK